MTEIEQIDSYIRENKAPLEGNIILNEILRNIERAFKKIRKKLYEEGIEQFDHDGNGRKDLWIHG